MQVMACYQCISKCCHEFQLLISVHFLHTENLAKHGSKISDNILRECLLNTGPILSNSLWRQYLVMYIKIHLFHDVPLSYKTHKNRVFHSGGGTGKDPS